MAGQFMQWEGKVTGDPFRRTEGKLIAAFGRMKQAISNVRRRRNSRHSGTATATEHAPRRS